MPGLGKQRAAGLQPLILIAITGFGPQRDRAPAGAGGRNRALAMPADFDPSPSTDFADYGPAYDFGVGGFVRYPGRAFEEVEPELAQDWASARGTSRLDWARARPASQDAWERVNVVVVRPLK